MDKQEIKKELALRELSRRKLEYFTTYVDPFFWHPNKAYVFKPFHKKITDWIERVMKWEISKLMISVPPQHGKLLSDNTPILTNKWWKRHWDLIVWDYVFNWQWKQIKVLALSKKDYTDYEITFSSWEKIKAHWNHEWYIYSRNNHKYIIKETKELLNLHRNKLRWVRWAWFNYWVDFTKPLEFKNKKLLINPYVLWVWLWDWTNSKDCITQSKEDIENTKQLFNERWYKFRREDIHKDTWVYTSYFDWLLDNIKKLGIYKNKIIPREYIDNSIENRLELLRWLLDSDWHIDNSWRIRFSNTNLDLINWVEEIIKSLWYRVERKNIWKAKEHMLNWNIIKSNKDIHILAFTPYNDTRFFNLKRKYSKQKKWKYRKNYIVNIRKLDEDEKEIWRCIEVEWWLYLAWKDLIITHNSTISSQRAPLFMHMKDPTLNIWLASYSQDLSKSHLSKIRQLTESQQFKHLSQINYISNTATSYELKEWGTFNAVWVWWSLTWKPIDIWIIDDVHKDRMEYESDTIRNWVWDWYTSVFLSRLHKDSKQILVMTRWWEDDLFWRILQLEPEEWEIINIPVLDWETTIFPERFPLDFITQKRKVMWERDFQSLYMWDPINEWWWDFKRDYFQYYQEHTKPQDLEIVTFIDPAISQKQEADNTAIVTIWLDRRSNNIYVLDVIAWRMLPDEIIENTFKTYIKWKPQRIWIEIVQYQKMLALEIRKQMNIRNIFFVLDEINPQWEKIARIRSILQPRYSNLSIMHNNTCTDLELELLKFPNWKHDDIIDSLASAVNMLDTFLIWNNNNVIETDYSSFL